MMVINLKGCAWRAPAPGFPGNWWANLTLLLSVNGSLLLPVSEKIVHMFFLPSAVNGGVILQDFFA